MPAVRSLKDITVNRAAWGGLEGRKGGVKTALGGGRGEHGTVVGESFEESEKRARECVREGEE